MRLATALLFFVQIALCGGAPAARMRTRAAAAVAAPVAAPLAPPAAAANIDGNEDIVLRSHVIRVAYSLSTVCGAAA